jgi:hypothetical protein
MMDLSTELLVKQAIEALDDLVLAVHKLGTADAATPMGAIELLSSEVKRVADGLFAIATSIDNLKEG